MKTRKYVLKLTADELAWLDGIVHSGKSAAWKIQHAHVLLKMNQGEDGPGWSDARIADAFGMTTRSLEMWRKRALEEGPQALLARQYASRPDKRRRGAIGEAGVLFTGTAGAHALDAEFVGRQAGGTAGGR